MQRYTTLLEENKLLRREIESTNTEFSKFKSLSSQLQNSGTNQASIQTSARDSSKQAL